jgi:hypothetical protein
MADITLRFFGRFVFVQPRKADPSSPLDVLAVNMQQNRDIRASKHTLVMTAPREMAVAVGAHPADLMVMIPGAASLAQCEHALWFLDGYNVTCENGERFDWPKNHDELIELAALNDGDGKVSTRAFAANSPLVSSIIRVTGGTVTVSQVNDETLDFVRLKAPREVIKGGFRLADVIEITMKVPSKSQHVMFRLTPRDGAHAVSTVIITGNDDAPTFVTFSHLCSGGRPGGEVDEEFAALYEVLERPPLTRERLIPRLRPTLGTRNDCYKSASATFP